eukprot:8764122-Alexandrium_andersonii.AAC.1
MSASLVGSEMCIRDRRPLLQRSPHAGPCTVRRGLRRLLRSVLPMAVGVQVVDYIVHLVATDASHFAQAAL